MSMRGGYQIIDLKNVPLYSGFLKDNVENHIHVKGIYYNLYHSNAKMILLSGLNMDNKPHRDYEIIPYEEDNEFKAILKKVWNTDKHLVYTYFLHIAEDDDVYITYEELDYDRVDKTFNDKSDIAIANSTVTKKVKALDAEDKTFVKLDGSRPLTGDLNIGTYKITNVGNPADNYDAVNKNFVDYKVTQITQKIDNYKFFDSVTLTDPNTNNSISALIRPGVVEIGVNIVSAAQNIRREGTFTLKETYDKYKSLYDSMGISYDKIIVAQSGFTVEDGTSQESKVALAIANCKIKLFTNSKSVSVTLNAFTADNLKTMAGMFLYNTVALFKVES